MRTAFVAHIGIETGEEQFGCRLPTSFGMCEQAGNERGVFLTHFLIRIDPRGILRLGSRGIPGAFTDKRRRIFVDVGVVRPNFFQDGHDLFCQESRFEYQGAEIAFLDTLHHTGVAEVL